MARTAAAIAAQDRGCDVNGCPNKHKGRGLCDKHLQRLRRLGSTDEPGMTFEERFWSKVDRRGPSDCWPWTAAVNEHGYGVMRPATRRRTGPTVKAHRVSAQLAGMKIDGLYVLHSCDNPPCVNPAHLRPGTAMQNSRDMVARRRTCHGERRPQTKLTTEQVLAIRRRHAEGESRQVLATEFGTSNANIGHIILGNTWRHLLDPPPVAEVIVSALVEAISGEALEVAA